MANVTIPNLTSATTIAPSTDLMVLEQTEGTRKATLSQIFTSSATSGSGLGITSGGVYAIKSGLDSDISDINTLLGSTSIASIGDGTVTGAVSQINSNLSASTVPENITVTFGSSAFTNKIFFCRRIGRMIFYNIRFTTGNVAYPISAAFALLSHPGSDLPVDSSQISMSQNGFIMYDTSINTTGTGIPTDDSRIGIFSSATLPANTNVYAFGFIMLK